MKLVVGDIHIIWRIFLEDLMDIFCLRWQRHICGWGEGPVSSVNLPHVHVDLSILLGLPLSMRVMQNFNFCIKFILWESCNCKILWNLMTRHASPYKGNCSHCRFYLCISDEHFLCFYLSNWREENSSTWREKFHWQLLFEWQNCSADMPTCINNIMASV